MFTENALEILRKRYFLKRDDGSQETESEFFERVSMGNPEYRQVLEALDFLPNSPTLFNLGTGQGTLSACFKFDVQDNMESIMDVATKAAFVQKWGGGVGYYLGNLRPFGTHISTTHGKSMGPVGKPSEGLNNGVLQHYHSVSMMITQAGKRDGAQMAIMPIEHPDIREFIHCKDEDPQSLSTFNISVSIGNEFMERVRDKDPEALDLFEEICESAWRTGDPGVYFRDTSEKTNPTPWLGELTGTNPCGEVPLLDNEPCNLGSINLSHFVKAGEPDFERLREVATIATRYLDDVLDNNVFPHPDIDKIARTTRKLGLGVMGWADMLALIGIPYDSEHAVSLAREVMGTIQAAAQEESDRLCNEKGPAPAYQGRNEQARRNATVTCIAPTGSISIIAGASSGIEPHFAREWSRTLGDGTVLNERIPVLDVIGDFVPKTANEIGIDWHVRHQAAFQRFTDLAVSKTINFANNATPQDFFHAYMLMWETGCKGGTCFRDGSRSEQVLRDKDKVEEYEGEGLNTHRKRLPKTRIGETHSFQVSGVSCYLTANWYPDTEQPAEIFITASTAGGTIDGALDSVAIGVSLALQQGTPLGVITDKLKGRKFEPAGLTDDPDIPTATSIVDYVARWLENRFLAESEQTMRAAFTGDVCPDCSGLTVREEGCQKCTNPACGWSQC